MNWRAWPTAQAIIAMYELILSLALKTHALRGMCFTNQQLNMAASYSTVQ